MDHGTWPFVTIQLDGPTFMVWLLENLFTRLFGPLISCNQMWTKRNDHTLKNECDDFFNIYPKREVLKNKLQSLTILLSSSFLPPQKNHWSFYSNNICLPWALASFLLEHHICLPHCKIRWSMSMDDVGLKICLLGTSNSMATLIFFPWCKPKWSHDEFNSQSYIL